MHAASFKNRGIIALGLAMIAMLFATSESYAQAVQPRAPALPPLSVAKSKALHTSTETWNAFLAQLPRMTGDNSQLTSPRFVPTTGGTWEVVTAAPAGGLCNPLLLTDGTVMAHDCNAPDWWKLTPDINGDYASGTWTQLASLPVIGTTQYEPLYHASAVLPDGRVVIMGGEYNGSNTEAFTNLGAIYDPLANIWTAVSQPSSFASPAKIGDAQSVVLANGTWMLGSCCDDPDDDALFNATTLGWTATGAPNAGLDYQDEQGYELLPNGNVLTIDIWTDSGENANPTNAEQYSPGNGSWSSAAPLPVSLVDPYQCGNFEIGPAALRQAAQASSPRKDPQRRPTRRRSTIRATPPGRRGPKCRPSARQVPIFRRLTAPWRMHRLRYCRMAISSSPRAAAMPSRGLTSLNSPVQPRARPTASLRCPTRSIMQTPQAPSITTSWCCHRARF